MEKPKAIITSKARIFLLEIFLTALFMIPVCYTFHFLFLKGNQKENRRGILFGQLLGLWPYFAFSTLFLIAFACILLKSY
jgi:TRAP-type mannitol/chloroaromatic compound transport system permease small subunit